MRELIEMTNLEELKRWVYEDKNDPIKVIELKSLVYEAYGPLGVLEVERLMSEGTKCPSCEDNGYVFQLENNNTVMYRCTCEIGKKYDAMFTPSDKKKEKPVRMKSVSKQAWWEK